MWNARRLAEFDSGITVTSVLHAADHYDATTPLHVDALAGTVVAARGRLARLRELLRGRDPGRAVPPLVLEVNPPALAAVSPRALADGVAELRAAGFAVALDGAGSGFGVDQVAVLAPDLVTVERDLVVRLPRDRRAVLAVRALLDVCAEIGTRVSAVGVATVDELLAVRDAGIDRARGPLLGGPRRLPSTVGLLMPVELMPRVAARGARPTPVGTAPAARPAAGRAPAFTLGGPAVTLPDAPRTVGLDADVRSVLGRCLSGDRDRSDDDVVLVDAGGLCTGVVRVSDLLQETTGAPAA